MRKAQARFDERLELLTVLFYMTKYKEELSWIVNLQKEEEYSLYNKILETFEKVDIRSMTEPFEKLLETENFGYDAPIAMFLGISSDFSTYWFDEKLYVERLRNNPLAIELVEAVLAFGKSDEWKQFYQSNELFYQKIMKGLTSLDLTKTYHLMEMLYGSQMPQEAEYTVLLMSGSSAGNYGVHVGDNIYCVSGLVDGTWYLDKSPSLVLHEFSHSIINPLTDKYLAKGYAEDKSLFADIEEKMEDAGYSNDPVCVINEYMVRTVECCYYKLYLPDEYEKALKYEIKVGFKDIEFLVEKYLKFLEENDGDFLHFYVETLQEFIKMLLFT